MSFSIEVPGEAVPLNYQDLCRALQAGNSADHSQRQSAGNQLNEWESHEDYYPSLQAVFLDKSHPHEVRFLAIILFKNGIDKYWRSMAADKGIRPDRKPLIRSRLFQGTVDEEDKTFAGLNAIAAAKIIRIDYPKDWPDALANILELLRASRASNPAHLQGALLLLLRAVKELSTARLRRSQTALQAVTPEIVQALGEIYAAETAIWLQFLTSGQEDEQAATYAMNASLSALKTLRRLMTAGYETPHESDLVREVWGLSQAQFGQFLGLVGPDSKIPQTYQAIVGKHMLQFTKLHIEMCETHAADFANLPNSIPLVHAYWDLVVNFADVFEKSGGIRQSAGAGPEAKSKAEGPLLERLALKGLLLLRSCIAMVFKPQQTFKYRSAEVKEQQKQSIQMIGSELLTNDFVLQIVNVIITRLFAFRQSDLEAWEESPEEWETQEREAGEAWQWQVRPCSERVFLDLLIHYKDLLGPPLLSYFQTAMQADSDAVKKEAVYTAMGCAANTVYKVFDFDAFLTSTLVNDAQQQSPLAKILRRRIAILLSQWVPIQIADSSRPIVFDIFRHFMNKGDPINDEVVRITAARQLKAVVDDYHFKPELFAPYASDILTQLVEILREVEVDETRLAILETTRVCVTRLDKNVDQVSDQIMAALPIMWDVAGPENYMVKQSVLGLLSNMTMALGANSLRYHHLVLPLISQSMDRQSPIHQFLLTDAVDVWQSIMSMTPPPLSQDLISLEPQILSLLEFESEISEAALEIVKHYIVLAPQAILADELREPTLRMLAKATDSNHRTQSSTAATCIGYVVRAAQEHAGPEGVSVTVQDLHRTGFLPNVLARLHEAHRARQAVGSGARREAASRGLLDTVKKTDYFGVLARVAYASPELFVQMLMSSSSSSPSDAAQPWKWLLEEWFEAVSGMAEVEAQKMACLALTRMCEVPDEGVQAVTLGHLQDYLLLWTTVVADVHEGDVRKADALVWTAESLLPGEWDTPYMLAERRFLAADPVHAEAAYGFVQARLEGLVRRVGGQERFAEEWLVNVDRDVVRGFEMLVQGQ